MAISKRMLMGVTAGLVLLASGAGFAQAAKDGAFQHGMGRGMGMMGQRFCQADESWGARIADRIERVIRPTDAQKADLEALRAAIAKAEGQLKAGCPTEAELADGTPPARLALMEKRLNAGLEAVRTVRPAFDQLYAKLDDTQRDRLRWLRRGPMFGFGPHDRG